MKKQDACDHIVGLAEGGGDESWLVYASERPKYLDSVGEDFKYCPMCGMKLWDSEVDSKVYKELF